MPCECNSKLIVVVVFSIISSLGYSLVVPLYPLEAASRGISETLIGIIISSYAFSNILFITITTKLLKKFSKFKLLVIALIIECSCTCIFGLISFISNKLTFIIISFLIRIIQGIASAFLNVILYSVTVGFSSKEDLETNIGYIQVGEGVGLTIGPIIASLGVKFFGFWMPFVASGTIEALTIWTVRILKPKKNEKDSFVDKNSNDEDNKKIDENNEYKLDSNISESNNESKVESSILKENENNILESKKNIQKITIFSAILNPRIFVTFFAFFSAMSLIQFMSPGFSAYLMETYKITENQASYFFSIPIFFFLIALQFIVCILKCFSHRVVICIGWVINTILILIISPSFFSPSIICVIIALCILGFCWCFISIPACVEILRILKEDFNLSDENEEEADDVSSALYNLAYSTGEAFGPIFGGFCIDKLGFVPASKINAITNLAGFFVYFFVIFCCGKKEIKEEEIKDDINIGIQNENKDEETKIDNTEYTKIDNEDKDNIDNENDKEKENKNEKEFNENLNENENIKDNLSDNEKDNDNDKNETNEKDNIDENNENNDEKTM